MPVYQSTVPEITEVNLSHRYRIPFKQKYFFKECNLKKKLASKYHRNKQMIMMVS